MPINEDKTRARREWGCESCLLWFMCWVVSLLLVHKFLDITHLLEDCAFECVDDGVLDVGATYGYGDAA